MKINGYTKEFLKVVSYRVDEVPDLGTVIYTDYYNENDRIVDSVIKTVDGYDIDVPQVFEIVQDFIDIQRWEGSRGGLMTGAEKEDKKDKE